MVIKYASSRILYLLIEYAAEVVSNDRDCSNITLAAELETNLEGIRLNILKSVIPMLPNKWKNFASSNQVLLLLTSYILNDLCLVLGKEMKYTKSFYCKILLLNPSSEHQQTDIKDLQTSFIP